MSHDEEIRPLDEAAVDIEEGVLLEPMAEGDNRDDEDLSDVRNESDELADSGLHEVDLGSEVRRNR